MTLSFVHSHNAPAAAQHSSAATPALTGGWVVIVGGSSSIGRALARQWAKAGSDLILAGRDLPDLQRTADDIRVRSGREVKVVSFDALAFDKHQAFWNECKAIAGEKLNGIVLLHGTMPVQADAQSDLAVARAAIDVNYVSVVSLLTYVANDFEARKRGFIAVFSSVAGDRGRQSNYVYGSAKAALSTFLGGLRVRLAKSHVNVLTVKPGFVDTSMTWGLPGLFLVASPENVAADVYHGVIGGNGVLYTPGFWRYIMLIIRMVPDFIFKRMKM